ncbi:hypothetical protein MKZ38_004539 [Zalerion maritima]|uniref:Beta-xylanase n=1 Tax=Zalerion maritima TaxID=339359 RepID=A0AAD5RLC7_9PEZI|nr:hypothetical protein MKZ38_004539 [Zalerion maritima]
MIAILGHLRISIHRNWERYACPGSLALFWALVRSAAARFAHRPRLPDAIAEKEENNGIGKVTGSPTWTIDAAPDQGSEFREEGAEYNRSIFSTPSNHHQLSESKPIHPSIHPSIQYFTMRYTTAASLALAASATANLNELAVQAGLSYFGSATDNSELDDTAYVAILSDSTEFGQITPGNGQKWQYIEPSQDTFDYTSGDEIAELAEGNGQILRCHTLVWHSQLPSWVSSGTWTVDTLTSVIENHIANEVGHYAGQCYAWDVVNEALNEDGTFRDSIFSETFDGGAFLPVAFAAAREADPDAKLYYNDYNIGYSGSKATAALAIIDLIRDGGAEIDGMGEQGHYIVGSMPSQSDLENVASAYVAMDVEYAFTEVDIRFSSLPATDDGLQQQAEDYAAVVNACLNVEGCIGITIWDYTDKYSWIPNTFDGQGAACLYDEDLEPKPAYTTVSDILASAAGVTATADPTTAETPTSSTTLVTSTTTSSSATSTATATAGHWGQCGGNNWSGPTACEGGYTCTYQNDWYSQCL